MPDTDEAVRALLHAAADPPGGPLHAPVDAVLSRARRRQHRRRGALLSGIALATVVAIAVPVTVASRSERATPATPSPSPTPSAGTVAALAADRWTVLPPSPIAPRSGAAVVWTGKQMLIWGGCSCLSTEVEKDGATYDPTTRLWATTPRSPLSARYQPAFTWTGKQLFVWGGHTANAIDESQDLQDGALYNPASRTWRALPASPLPQLSQSAAMTVGGGVIVVGVDRTNALVAAKLDPSDARWRLIPAPDVPLGHKSFSVRVVAVGSHGHLVTSWATDTSSGYDAYEYDAAANTWQDESTPPYVAHTSQMVSFGGSPVIAGGENELPGSAGPYSIAPTYQLNAQRWASMRSPVLPAVSSPTEEALIQVGVRFAAHGASVPQASAYDAATRDWTTLATPPVELRDNAYYAAVWTGRELLVWGVKFVPGHGGDVPQEVGWSLGHVGPGPGQADPAELGDSYRDMGLSVASGAVGGVLPEVSAARALGAVRANNGGQMPSGVLEEQLRMVRLRAFGAQPGSTPALSWLVLFHAQIPFITGGAIGTPQKAIDALMAHKAMTVYVVDATTGKIRFHGQGDDTWP